MDPGTERTPTKWEPALVSCSTMIIIPERYDWHQLLGLSPGLLLRKSLGAASQGGGGADSTRGHSWNGVQVSGLNPEFGDAPKALGMAGPSAASGGGGRQGWNVAASLWAASPGTRETLPFWAGCLETGARIL